MLRIVEGEHEAFQNTGTDIDLTCTVTLVDGSTHVAEGDAGQQMCMLRTSASNDVIVRECQPRAAAAATECRRVAEIEL